MNLIEELKSNLVKLENDVETAEHNRALQTNPGHVLAAIFGRLIIMAGKIYISRLETEK